jgi:molybdenum cofactor biosynthesis protein MoaC
MQDITLKPTTLRQARAESALLVPTDVIARIREGRVAKGDVREVCKIAGLMAVKKTPDWLPHCHPIPVLDAAIEVLVEDTQLRFTARVTTLAATGVEMEALTAASAAALCAWDMLKPYADASALAIQQVRLLEKTGGKSDYARRTQGAKAVVILCSDAVASGKKKSAAPQTAVAALEQAGFSVAPVVMLNEDPPALRAALDAAITDGAALILTLGSTGVGPRDRAVETVQPLLTLELPGVMEAARSFGQARTPYALLSRGIAGLIGTTLVVTLPGSTAGVRESLAAILPGLIQTLAAVRRSY